MELFSTYFAFFQVGLFFGYPEFITAYGLLDDEKNQIADESTPFGKRLLHCIS